MIDHRTVGAFEENCYLLVDDETNRAVLIDPGDEGERILEMVDRAGTTELEGSELSAPAQSDGEAESPNASTTGRMADSKPVRSRFEGETVSDSVEPIIGIDDVADRSAEVQSVLEEPVEASADPSDAAPIIVPKRETPVAPSSVASPVDARRRCGAVASENRGTQEVHARPLAEPPVQLKAISPPTVKTFAFAPRQLVLLLLATAAVAIVSSMLVLSIERRFSPPAAAPIPNDR